MSGSLSKILIVVPAYNEEQSVKITISEIYKYLPSTEVLVVNDGSKDNTSVIAKSAGAKVIDLPYNMGVGGAMRVGFKYALLNNFDAVIQIDADGQHNPSQVPMLLEQLSHFDLVIGARFAGKGNYQANGPRKLAMIFLAQILSKSTGVRLTDTTSGFRASGRKAILLFASHYPAEYLGDTLESLVIAHKSGLLITQVPVSMRERIGGVPSQNTFKSMIFLARVGLAMIFAFTRPKLTSTEELK